MAKKYQQFYLDTSREQVKELSGLLLAWEKRGNDRYLLEEIMRLTHAMKGAAATMDYQRTAGLLHAVEDIFYAVLQHQLPVSGRVIDALLKVIETLKKNIDSLGQTGKEIVMTGQLKSLKKLLLVSRKQKNKFAVKDVSLRNINHSQKTFYTPLEIVVPTFKLDKIQNSVDNLIMNQLRLKNAHQASDPSQMLAVCSEADKVIRDLRREISELRLLPLQQIFTPLPHLVRELAKAEHKKVDLLIEDNNFSLDKAIIDDLMDIIIQLLRNAVVHGISAKQTDGQIILRTELINDQIKVTVADNGQGIDWLKIKQLAKQKKMLPNRNKTSADQDLKNLIFHPGLSATAKANLRGGRGVGLSLVKERVDALKGRIILESAKNRGTKFTVFVPQPASVFNALVFHLNQFNLALPLSRVSQIIRLPAVADFSRQKYYLYHRVKYPLLSLAKSLGLPVWTLTTNFLAVIKQGEQNKLLPLPTNTGDEEVVSKRLPKILQSNLVISGVALDSRGLPVLVLDVNNLIG